MQGFADTYDNEYGQEEEGQEDPNWLKVLRQKARAYDQELPALKQKIAVVEAGIDTTNPLYDLWAKAYKADGGDWSTDSVLESAKKYAQFGLVKGEEPAPAVEETPQEPAPQPVQQQPTPEQAAHERISQAGESFYAPPPGENAEWLQAQNMAEFLAKYAESGGRIAD